MKTAAGNYIPLSPQRKMIGDMLYAGSQLMLIPGERTMQLAEVVAARNGARPRPSWLALFIKAYAAVAARRPELRRVLVNYPWQRLYEYKENIVSVVMEREWQGEPGLFLARIPSPEKMSLAEIDAVLKNYKERPVEQIRGFRNALWFARLPLFLRRGFWSLVMNWMPGLRAKMLGTMGCSITAGMGGTALSLTTPWTLTFFYDQVQDDGSQVVRNMFDHRVMDGKSIAWAMKDVERELRGPILQELLALHPEVPARAA